MLGLKHTTPVRTLLEDYQSVAEDSTHQYADKTHQSQETDNSAPIGIQTRNASKRGAADPRLRPRCHRDRRLYVILQINKFLFHKTNRHTKFPNLFCQETVHVSGSSSAHHQDFSTVHSALVYIMQVWWHIPQSNVQWKTPDDGHRNCPKHVEFLDKINLWN